MIVSPEGYILTNNHVVDGATDVRVTLSDKRQLKAKVVGTDPKTDIAVLKIDATELPAITIGDSSKMQIGDYALAVGDPFGVGQTVTMGIVSATGRGNLGIEDYEDFIQTDAPINPGNSGGALINDRGELIGINTAILSHGSGGNQGIGFAVPVNLARTVMDQILEHGKVNRAYLGIMVQDVTPAIAKAHGTQGHAGRSGRRCQRPTARRRKSGMQRRRRHPELNGKPMEDSRTAAHEHFHDEARCRRDAAKSCANGARADIPSHWRTLPTTQEQASSGTTGSSQRGSGWSDPVKNLDPGYGPATWVACHPRPA